MYRVYEAFFFTLDERQSFYLIKGPANVEARRGNFVDFLRVRALPFRALAIAARGKKTAGDLRIIFIHRHMQTAATFSYSRRIIPSFWRVYMRYERNFASNR